MCEFITAILPRDVNLTVANGLFLKYGRGFKKLDSYRIDEYITTGDHYILTTSGMCDCGTSLGNGDEPMVEPSPEEVDKARRQTVAKLKAKGWSDSRIKRWFEQVDGGQAAKQEVRESGDDEDIIQWLALIRESLESSLMERLGLLIHTYSSGVENERLPRLDKETFSLQDLTVQVLENTRKDIIYEFVRK